MKSKRFKEKVPITTSSELHRAKSNPKRLPKTFKPKRTCMDCTVFLSIYNETERCWEHRDKERPRLRGTSTVCASCVQMERYRQTGAIKILVDDVWHREGKEGMALMCDAL